MKDIGWLHGQTSETIGCGQRHRVRNSKQSVGDPAVKNKSLSTSCLLTDSKEPDFGITMQAEIDKVPGVEVSDEGMIFSF
jgi:hypothetical protein